MWIVVIAVSAAGCARKRPAINGIGSWVLLETPLRDAPGFCSPDTITFCSGNGSVSLGGQPASVGLYFRGSQPTSPLVEITLTVRRCDPGALARALVDVLGDPSSRVNHHMMWRGKLAFVAAAVPAPQRRCEVSFVTIEDRPRIAELTAQAETKDRSSAR